jgi:hypothetical protein
MIAGELVVELVKHSREVVGPWEKQDNILAGKLAPIGISLVDVALTDAVIGFGRIQDFPLGVDQAAEMTALVDADIRTQAKASFAVLG